MNKKLTTAGAALNASSYVSPETKVTEIHTEGVLCFSAVQFMDKNTIGFEDWEEKSLDW